MVVGESQLPMCGRYTLSTPAEVYEAVFQIALRHELRRRYNIAPTQAAPVIRQSRDESGRESVLMRWGLIPSWAKDATIGNRMINARLETAPIKPSFRAAFKHRRCLVPADGFYEWKREDRRKQPYCIRLANGNPFAFGGLWESWRDPDGAEIESYTILTTTPTEPVSRIHDRMPLIIAPEHFDRWFDQSVQDREGLAEALHGPAAGELTAYAVRTLVNSPANDVPACMEPIGP